MAGSFKTETGCVVGVRDAPEIGEGVVVVSMRVDHPGNVGYFKTPDTEPDVIQYAEFALSNLDRLAFLSMLQSESVLDG